MHFEYRRAAAVADASPGLSQNLFIRHASGWLFRGAWGTLTPSEFVIISLRYVIRVPGRVSGGARASPCFDEGESVNRRTALKVVAGGLIGGGAGVSILTTAFKPELRPVNQSKKLELKTEASYWRYHKLDPVITGNLAYRAYDVGSCMYAVVHSFVSQLAAKFGEPYASFPVHMMKYGHGGVGGYGTLCGALNGAASLLGLFVADKSMRDALIEDLFRWYEVTPLPAFKPAAAVFDFVPPVSVCKSTLCHISTTQWAQVSGCRAKSKERSERCRRLTGDVATRLTVIMNQLADNIYMTTSQIDENSRACITCHDKEGKVGNTSTKMDCTTCHTQSLGHKLFGDIHYKLMDKRE